MSLSGVSYARNERHDLSANVERDAVALASLGTASRCAQNATIVAALAGAGFRRELRSR